MTTRQPSSMIIDNEYYDASQVQLYIGDVWVDEITSFQYQLNQMKKPIFGYASQLWDDHAAGQVIVQGNFTINFKEAGYLWAVLRRYKQLNQIDVYGKINVNNAIDDDSLLNVRKGGRVDQPELTNGKDVRVGSNGTAISRLSIERICNGEITRGERFKFYHDLMGYSTFNNKNRKDKVFEDIMEAFEDQAWNPTVTNSELNYQSRRTDDNLFDGFDIYMVFGDYSNPRANHTVNKLTNVILTSSGKEVKVGGMPIQESYNFLARSVV